MFRRLQPPPRRPPDRYSRIRECSVFERHIRGRFSQVLNFRMLSIKKIRANPPDLSGVLYRRHPRSIPNPSSAGPTRKLAPTPSDVPSPVILIAILLCRPDLICAIKKRLTENSTRLNRNPFTNAKI
jgi:hypothetical protein